MNTPGYTPPDPDANRREWLARHPEAAGVTADEAAAGVAEHLGAGAPGAGVADTSLGEQMAQHGAAAGLPHEDTMNALMKQVQDLSEQMAWMQEQRARERQAAIAAMGEPILERYARGLRDKLKAHADANPGLGPDHLRQVIADADELLKQASLAIARGANDLGAVHSAASRVDRFLSKTHVRTAAAHLRHIDLSSVAYDLEMVVEEAARLVPGALALA